MRFANQRARAVALIILVALLVVELLLISRAGPVAASDPGAESEFLALLNRDRSAAGLPPLSVSGDLVDVARQHSVEMAEAGKVFHVDFASRVCCWLAIAENVGMHQSVEAMHESFTSSAPHRQNLMDSRFTQVGIGVEWRGPNFYVTEIFRQPRRAEAAPAPAPAPTPAAAPAPRPTPSTTAPKAAPTTAPTTTAPPTTVVSETPTTTVPPTSVVEDDQEAVEPVEDARSAGWRLDGGTLVALVLGLLAGYLIRRGRAEQRGTELGSCESPRGESNS